MPKQELSSTIQLIRESLFLIRRNSDVSDCYEGVMNTSLISVENLPLSLLIYLVIKALNLDQIESTHFLAKNLDFQKSPACSLYKPIDSAIRTTK